jgi:hypothetical protein
MAKLVYNIDVVPPFDGPTGLVPSNGQAASSFCIGVAGPFDLQNKTTNVITYGAAESFHVDLAYHYVAQFEQKGEISQRQFWAFQDVLTSQITTSGSSIESLADLATIDWDDLIELVAYSWNVKKRERVVSARARAHIFQSILDLFRNSSQERPSIHALRALFAAKLKQFETIRTIFVQMKVSRDVPSMHAWAHGHMLATGISPPSAAATELECQPILFVAQNEGGHSVPNFRSDSCRHRRRLFDMRTRQGDRRSDFSCNPLATVGALTQRRERFRIRSLRQGWALHYPRVGKMGGQLCDERRS